MHFSLNHAFLLLALANGFVEPVDATTTHNEPPLRHSLFKRATDGFHKTALRHSSGLARDLRIAFRGLGGPARLAVVRSNNKAYCVSSAGLSTSNGTGSNENHSTATPTSTAKGSATATASSTQLNWQLAQSYVRSLSLFSLRAGRRENFYPGLLLVCNFIPQSGSTFFSGWDFFTGGDPTNGIVEYVDQQTAVRVVRPFPTPLGGSNDRPRPLFQQSSNLIQINAAGNAIMRVDTTPQVTGNRNSVRIQTQYAFTGGLVIMDSVHMPTGCGTWPAFWSNGQDWPTTGEIDIVEGVNNYTNNQATVHTGTGCDLPTSNSAALGISGSVVGGTNCAALQTGNEGCGVRASQTNSFGAAFNNAGGGVFASALSTMLFTPNLEGGVDVDIGP